jgi:hypothetical protein
VFQLTVCIPAWEQRWNEHRRTACSACPWLSACGPKLATTPASSSRSRSTGTSCAHCAGVTLSWALDRVLPCLQKIEEAWGIKVFNSYGLSEMNGPGVAFECPEKSGMHFWEDDFYVEVIDSKTLLEMREAIETVHVDPDLERYIAEIVQQTRADRHVAVGASPRGSLAFLKTARAYAAMQGRDYILPDDVKHFARPVLVHRIILQPEYWLTRQVSEKVVEDVVARVSVPVLD